MQVEEDTIEREKAYHVASLERSAEYIQELSVTHPYRKDERDYLLEELKKLDSAAYGRVMEVLKEAGEAGDDMEKLGKIQEKVRSWDPDRRPVLEPLREIQLLGRHQQAELEGKAATGGRKRMQ